MADLRARVTWRYGCGDGESQGDLAAAASTAAVVTIRRLDLPDSCSCSASTPR